MAVKLLLHNALVTRKRGGLVPNGEVVMPRAHRAQRSPCLGRRPLRPPHRRGPGKPLIRAKSRNCAGARSPGTSRAARPSAYLVSRHPRGRPISCFRQAKTFSPAQHSPLTYRPSLSPVGSKNARSDASAS